MGTALLSRAVTDIIPTMADRHKEIGSVPYTRSELNELLGSGLRQMRVAASGVLPNGRILHERAADRLCRNGFSDAEKALRIASKERLKLDKILAFRAYNLGVNCTLYNVDMRLLERNVELALL